MIRFVHVPKTGGVALREALTGHILCDGHQTTLESAEEDEVITILRDPVDRYVSAFWWLATKTMWPWPSPEHMALRMDTELVANAFKRYMVLWPQSHWINADKPLLWEGRTETLDDDVARLRALVCFPVTLPRRNVGRYPHVPMSPQATDIVRAFYADDYTLLKRLA